MGREHPWRVGLVPDQNQETAIEKSDDDRVRAGAPALCTVVGWVDLQPSFI